MLKQAETSCTIAQVQLQLMLQYYPDAMKYTQQYNQYFVLRNKMANLHFTVFISVSNISLLYVALHQRNTSIVGYQAAIENVNSIINQGLTIV